jgi:acyl carrier protein
MSEHDSAQQTPVQQTPAQREMAELLVEALNLEDVTAAKIEPQQTLFGEGLGLDSIDALEIALAISQKYGVQMQAEDETTRNAFATLAALTDFVAQHKQA